MYLQKVISKELEEKNLLTYWRSLKKIAGSGSISQRYGSADPDPDTYKNFMDPQHRTKCGSALYLAHYNKTQCRHCAPNYKNIEKIDSLTETKKYQFLRTWSQIRISVQLFLKYFLKRVPFKTSFWHPPSLCLPLAHLSCGPTATWVS
jgi:hypothetical protein